MGSLAALYAASRGCEVEIYELRGGEFIFFVFLTTRPRTPRTKMATLSFRRRQAFTFHSKQPIASDHVMTMDRSSGSLDNAAQLHQIHQFGPIGAGHQCDAPRWPAEAH